MAEFVAVLTTSWRLIRAIQGVVQQIDQTREDGRALQYLERQATSFLETTNRGLANVEPSPYMPTISSLEGLLRRILETSTTLVRVSRLKRVTQTKRTILDLEKELRFFLDTYLIQTATQIARINLEAMASPPPVPGPNDLPLVPDDIQWEIMTQSTTPVGSNTRTRILSWNGDVVNENVVDLEAGHHIHTEPIPSAPMTVPNSALVGADPEPQSSYKLCWDVWSKAVIGISVGIVYMVFVGPLHAVICILDCLGCLCCDPHNGCCCCFCCCGWHDGRDALIGLDEGCCTNCCLHFFPVCTSEECLAYSRCERDTTGSGGWKCGGDTRFGCFKVVSALCK